MLTMTESAGTCLVQLLADRPSETVVRLVPTEQGLAIQVGEVMPGDVTLAHDEQTVLAIDPQVSELLAEKTLDAQNTEQGTQLMLK